MALVLLLHSAAPEEAVRAPCISFIFGLLGSLGLLFSSLASSRARSSSPSGPLEPSWIEMLTTTGADKLRDTALLCLNVHMLCVSTRACLATIVGRRVMDTSQKLSKPVVITRSSESLQCQATNGAARLMLACALSSLLAKFSWLPPSYLEGSRPPEVLLAWMDWAAIASWAVLTGASANQSAAIGCYLMPSRARGDRSHQHSGSADCAIHHQGTASRVPVIDTRVCKCMSSSKEVASGNDRSTPHARPCHGVPLHFLSSSLLLLLFISIGGGMLLALRPDGGAPALSPRSPRHPWWVDPWLEWPMLSDLWTTPRSALLARLMLPLAAFLGALAVLAHAHISTPYRQAILLPPAVSHEGARGVDRSSSAQLHAGLLERGAHQMVQFMLASEPTLSALPRLNHQLHRLGLVAAVGLAIAGVCNECEIWLLHNIGAAVFFCGYSAFATLDSLLRVIQREPPWTDSALSDGSTTKPMLKTSRVLLWLFFAMLLLFITQAAGHWYTYGAPSYVMPPGLLGMFADGESNWPASHPACGPHVPGASYSEWLLFFPIAVHCVWINESYELAPRVRFGMLSLGVQEQLVSLGQAEHPYLGVDAYSEAILGTRNNVALDGPGGRVAGHSKVGCMRPASTSTTLRGAPNDELSCSGLGNSWSSPFGQRRTHAVLLILRWLASWLGLATHVRSRRYWQQIP